MEKRIYSIFSSFKTEHIYDNYYNRYLFYVTNDINETKIVKFFAGILSEIVKYGLTLQRYLSLSVMRLF